MTKIVAGMVVGPAARGLVGRRAVLTGLAASAAAGIALPRAGRAAAARYTALALQTRCDAVNQDTTRADARARMAATIARLRGEIATAKGFTRTFNGTDVRLVVLPEYVLTGFPFGESLGQWRDKAAIDPDGPEYDALAAIAGDLGLYLAGNAYETDANFPELYFQTCFIIAPSGRTVLRYRRLISLYTPTPYDVWDRYLELYGLDGVFPVARTDIGALAAIASEEILYPEVARCLAMRGAEIFCHPTSEVGSPMLTQKDVAKRARAIENMAYVISANTAGIYGTSIPAESTDAMSKVIAPTGLVLAEAGEGASINANATLDLDGLRQLRGRAGMHNQLARQPFAAYADSYASHQHHRPNGFLDGGRTRVPERADLIARQRAVIERLSETGVLTPPGR